MRLMMRVELIVAHSFTYGEIDFHFWIDSHKKPGSFTSVGPDSARHGHIAEVHSHYVLLGSSLIGLRELYQRMRGKDT